MSSEFAPEPTPASSPWSSRLPAGVVSVLIAFVASRFIIFAIIIVSKMIVIPGRFAHPGGLLSILTDWDGAWYISIAQNGYSFTPGKPSNMGFFPFYPILIWLASFIFQNYAIAAVVVSHLCLLGAGLLLNSLINLDYDDARLNHAAAMFLMFNPVSFFFSDAYSESTFLMLALAAFLAARKGYWTVACLSGMCLAATRQVGFLIALPLVLEFIRAFWNPTLGLRSLLEPRILLLALVPLGFGLFLLYGYFAFGDATTYMQATGVWGRKFTSPFKTIKTLVSHAPFYQTLFAGSLIVGVGLWGAALDLKLRASYVVFAAALIAIYLCSNSLEAIPRNLSVIFPFYIVLALLTRRFEWSYTPVFAASVMLLTLCTILSANGYWMT